jgi:hypothetical protein
METIMEWFKARLREDSTRSGIGQMAVIILVICVLVGVDVGSLLTEAQVTVERIAAAAAAAVGLWSSISRIVAVEPPKVPRISEIPQLDPAAIEGLKRLAEHLGPRP